MRQKKEKHGRATPLIFTHATQSILDLTGFSDLTDIVFLEDNLTGLVTLVGVSPLPLSFCCALATEESLFMIPSRVFLLFFFFGDTFTERRWMSAKTSGLF